VDLVGFIIRICHDARSHKLKKKNAICSDMDSCRLYVIKIGLLLFTMHYVDVEKFSEEQNEEEMAEVTNKITRNVSWRKDVCDILLS